MRSNVIQEMKTIISIVLGIAIGAGSMSLWSNHRQNSKRNLVEKAHPFQLEESKESTAVADTPMMVTGDITNVLWQKHIYQLALDVHKGDLLGERRVEAQREVDSYYRLCEAADSNRFTFIRAERIEELHHMFQGVDHFREHIEAYRESNPGYHYSTIRLVGDGEDDFYRFACREYFQFLVDDEEDGIVGWDEIRQKLATELFQIDHTVSDRGLYGFLSENFDSAVSKETYLNFKSLGWDTQNQRKIRRLQQNTIKR